MAGTYHYTECGLDNVWLHGGFDVVNHPAGKQLRIRDLEGLHKLIGNVLATKKGDLTGKEIRFLRQEMLMTQGLIAKLLGVTEQTVHRWESGKADAPKPAESLIRLTYESQLGNINVREALERLAELEDQLDGLNFAMRNRGRVEQWQFQESKVA